MKKTRKGISLLLACVMFFGTFGVTAAQDTIEAKAALRSNFTRADNGTASSQWLSPAANSSMTAPAVRSGTASGTATVKWDIVQPMRSGSRITLEYPVIDGLAARFTVSPLSETSATGRYAMTYRLVSYTEAPAGSGNYVESLLPITPGTDDLRINNGRDQWLYTEDLTGSLNVPYFYVDRDPATQSPVFGVRSGHGFSFVYSYVYGGIRREIQGNFLVNSKGTGLDEIIFTTNQIPNAQVFDFTLTEYSDGNTDKLGTVYVMNNIIKDMVNYTDFVAAPKAEAYKTRDVEIDLRAEGQGTAMEENRINMSFGMPRIWDSASHKFIGLTDTGMTLANYQAKADAGLGAVGMTIVLLDTLGSRYVLKVNDFFHASGGAVEPAGVAFFRNELPVTGAGTGVQTPYIDAATGRFVMEIGPLPYKLLFNSVDIYLEAPVTAAKEISFSRTLISEVGIAYTFTKYRIVAIHGSYYVEAEPYTGFVNGQERGISGTYSLKDLFISSTTVVSKADSSSDTTKSIMLPVFLSNEGGSTCKPMVEFELKSPTASDPSRTRTVYTQRGVFVTRDDDFTIDTPLVFDIVKYTLVPRDRLTGGANWEDMADLAIDIAWDVAGMDLIRSLMKDKEFIRVTYAVNSSLVPPSNNLEPPPDSKTVAVIELTITRNAVNPNRFDIAYSMPDPVPLPEHEFPVPPAAYASTDDTMKAYARLRYEVSRKTAVMLDHMFKYPNIYFMNIQPIEIYYEYTDPLKPSGILKDYAPPASMYESLTLNDTTEPQLPPPADFTIGPDLPDDGEVSLTAIWNAPVSQIRAYLEQLPAYDMNEFGFDIFMCEKPGTITDFLEKLNNITGAAEKAAFMAANTVVIDWGSGGYADLDIRNEAAALDALRNGKIVALRGLSLEFTDATGDRLEFTLRIIGLDKNRQYFFTMGTSLLCTIFDPDPDDGVDETIERREYSSLVGIVSGTTLGDPQEPNPLDRFPKAPELVVESKTSNSAVITWKSISEPTDEDNNVEIGYEIIRIRDNELKTKDKNPNREILNSRIPFRELFDQITNQREYIKAFELTPGGLSLVLPAASPRKEPDGIRAYQGDPVRMEDTSLVPNTIYFYYVRTYKQVKGEEGKRSYSEWSVKAITSSPVDPPENLVYERDRTDFNRETEAVISFDAPVTDMTVNSAGNTLGGYKFQYQLRLDNGDWQEPADMNAQQLRSGSSEIAGRPGYRHFLYKLTGLESGKTYFVRVRILDSKGVASVYTNIVEIRTKMNQDDYDEQILTNDWLEYLKEKLQDVIREQYWTGLSGQLTCIQYRPSTFPAIMNSSPDSGIKLAAPSTVYTEYYIPAESYKLAADNGKSFIAEAYGLRVIIPANAADLSESSAVGLIKERIKANSIAGYYIRISVSFTDQTAYVNGIKPLSKNVTITLDAVGSYQNTGIFDDELYGELVKLIAAKTESKSLQDELKRLVSSGTSNEELVKYIDKLVAETKTDFSSVFNRLRQRNIRDSYAVTPLAKNMLISFGAQDMTATQLKGFNYTGGLWMELPLIDMGSAKAISTPRTGSFIFAGQSLADIRLDGITGAADALALIAKYSLTDFIGAGSLVNTGRAVTGSEFAGTVARIAGAKNTDNAFDFLKSKGIVISTLKSQGAVSKQEAIYLTCALYEIKSGKKISSVVITNYNLTSGITGIDQKYLKSVQVAYQLGIYSDKNLQPKANATIGDMLQMLVNLNKKIKL